ncbi:MAG: isoleucine--tRNA ligase, partial [Bosea sp. (in: a-proteobacteria)]
WKIEEQYRAKGLNKDEVPVVEFRKECRAFAEHWVDVQREEFKRLGVCGDWDNPYLTMTYPAEAQIAREIMKFASSGQLYRGSKPVMWSVVEKTALAEAEIEYEEFTSDTVFVAFPVADVSGITHGGWTEGRSKTAIDIETNTIDQMLLSASVVIWTTTPWTMPGNRAISFNNKISYGLYELSGLLEGSFATVGKRYILADKLADDVFAKAKAVGTRLMDVPSSLLADITCAHPLAGWSPSPLEGEGARRADEGSTARSDVTQETSSNHTPHPSASRPPSPARGEGKTGAYEFTVPLLDGDHVTDDAGTGFVHTAPGHGREDFDIWMANGRQLTERGIETRIPYTVDADGRFTKDAPGFEGKQVITDKGDKGDANQAVITALIEAGNLVARGRLKHQYPHSWRSKKPVIFRNTPQWFIAMDKPLAVSPSPLAGEGGPARSVGTDEGSGATAMSSPSPHPSSDPSGHLLPQGEKGRTLREIVLGAIKETEWVPPQGENRITGMIQSKPDWVVSRQRAWGVPITVFAKEDGEVLRDDRVDAAIADAFEKEGADAWFSDLDGSRFLKPFGHDPKVWRKVTDVLDVWFDSGSTHAYTLEDPKNFPGFAGLKRKVDGGADTVMYLEGSDQHRGWFHSSLIESCGTRGRAPYDVVLTHGFTMDEKGQKMSKSLGNVVAPQKVISASGADILRLWVASVDYSDDQRIGPEILKNMQETYRKLRNTMRWMLGTLAHFDEAQRVSDASAMPELEQLMLHRLAELDPQVRAAYADYDYKKVIALLSQFMTADLSAFYFDIRKDILYCDPASSHVRACALSAVDALFDSVTRWIAPILVFTAEEAWLERHAAVRAGQGSVHLETFPALPESWHNPELAERWAKVRRVRRVITGALELDRAAKRIGSSLEAMPRVWLSDADLAAALSGLDMAEICITSRIAIDNGQGPDDAFRLDDVAGVAVVIEKASGIKCARSWKYFDPATADPAYPDVTPRDAIALREIDAKAA